MTSKLKHSENGCELYYNAQRTLETGPISELAKGECIEK